MISPSGVPNVITHKMTVVRGVNISETDGWLHRTTVEMTFENLFESIKYCLDNFKVKIVLEARVVLNLTMALASTENFLFILLYTYFFHRMNTTFSKITASGSKTMS